VKRQIERRRLVFIIAPTAGFGAVAFRQSGDKPIPNALFLK